MTQINPALLVKSICISPTGEYSYAVKPIMHPNGVAVNIHHPDKTKSDITLSIEQLKKTLPNVEWISVEVHWFVSSINADKARIMPKVEYSDNKLEWKVAEYTRKTAQEVSHSEEDKPNYGGTPTDASIIELCDFLKDKGYKIMLSPMLIVDDAAKSWRGFIKPMGKPNQITTEIDNFFNDRKYGYNKFILHYAELLKNLVDQFSIGNELKGLTLSATQSQQFPAVNQLVDLASQVKEILGETTKTTYIANYGEYHHTDGGLYALDNLWGDNNLDVITIYAMFPLTDNLSQNQIACRDIKEGWSSGEGWDYYKSGNAKVDFEGGAWAWKNFKYWWEHHHLKEDGDTTRWNPEQQKPLALIYSFASISGIANHPDEFYTWKSPIFDIKAQSLAIAASESYFEDLNQENSNLLPQRFLSYWDSRPYPYYPEDCNTWSDCKAWQFNPAVNGKIGTITVEASGCIPELNEDL